jgi:hypothetical protein
VSVLFIEDGRDPVMVIKEKVGGQERQRIPLKRYKTVKGLHKLMEKLGFQQRTRKELEHYNASKKSIQQQQDQENLERVLADLVNIKKKREEVTAKVLKMMEDNLKNQQEIKV